LKKTVFLLFTIIFALSISVSALDNVNWISSRNDIIKYETSEPVFEDAEFLGFSTTLYNKTIEKIYIFKEDKLISIFYIIAEDRKELEDYLTSYQEINDLLTKDLGVPLFKDEDWEDERYKESPELALILGDVRYNTTWIKNNIITHTIYAKDLSVNHIIFINPLDSIRETQPTSAENHPDFDDI